MAEMVRLACGQASPTLPAKLLMLVGIPGSGKSTWAKQYLIEHPRYGLVSTDQIRAVLYGDATVQGDWQQVWQQVVSQWQQSLERFRQGQLAGVLYDATNARRRHRRQAVGLARELGFNHITLVWLDVPLGLGLRRNRRRSRQVPPDVIVKMHRQLQGAPPTLSEDVDHILHFRMNENLEFVLN